MGYHGTSSASPLFTFAIKYEWKLKTDQYFIAMYIFLLWVICCLLFLCCSHLNKKTQYDPPMKSPDSNLAGPDTGMWYISFLTLLFTMVVLCIGHYQPEGWVVRLKIMFGKLATCLCLWSEHSRLSYSSPILPIKLWTFFFEAGCSSMLSKVWDVVFALTHLRTFTCLALPQ